MEIDVYFYSGEMNRNIKENCFGSAKANEQTNKNND